MTLDLHPALMAGFLLWEVSMDTLIEGTDVGFNFNVQGDDIILRVNKAGILILASSSMMQRPT